MEIKMIFLIYEKRKRTNAKLPVDDEGATQITDGTNGTEWKKFNQGTKKKKEEILLKKKIEMEEVSKIWKVCNYVIWRG